MIPDSPKPTRKALMTTLAVLTALMMVTTPVAAAGASGGSAQPLASAFDFGLDLGPPDVPGDAISYGTDSKPGIMVTVESSEDVGNLKEWANATDGRMVVEQYNSTNTVLVAASPSDIRPGLLDVESWLGMGSDDTISSLGYVTGWSWDRQVGMADPIANLDTDDAFQSPPGALYAELVSSGSYSSDIMAWDSNAPDSNLTHARGLVAADQVQASGDGVNVAVIDSGVNFGNGQLYGDGTAGSDMRVTDAYDYVDGEEPDLTVPRSELPGELEKMADPNGHGSWVSSAVLNARNGVAPNASLMAYRALDSEGSGSTANIRGAVERADSNGADILVMSLGSPAYSEGLADPLKHALGPDGNVTGAFVAVGNSYTTTRYVSSPADVEAVIGVSATNAVNASDARKAYFANVGPDTGLDGSGGSTSGVLPDTAAPGMAIATPTYTAPGTEGGQVTDSRLSGTSMAAPIAGGVGALVLDAEPGLEGEQSEFHDRIVESGTHTPHIGTTHSEGGMVNATRAINGYDSEPAPDRNLSDTAAGIDAANNALTGDVGVKMATMSDWVDIAL